MRSKIIKPFSYVRSEDMKPNYLRDKFARIRTQQRKEQEDMQREQQQKVRKIK